MIIPHDAFRGRKGLSDTRAVALEAIERGGIRSAAELAEATGLKLVTAQRCLTELRKEGLIVKRRRVWCRTELDLDTVARKRGSAGATAVQRAQYERDRDSYAERLVDFLKEGGGSKSKKRNDRRLEMVPAPERRHDMSPPDPVWDEEEEEEVRMAALFKRRRGRMAA